MKQALILDETVVKRLKMPWYPIKGNNSGKSSLKILSSHRSSLKVWGKEQTQLMKTLLKDPEYQAGVIEIMKNPEVEKMMLQTMKSKEYRQYLQQVLTETAESPLFKPR